MNRPIQFFVESWAFEFTSSRSFVRCFFCGKRLKVKPDETLKEEMKNHFLDNHEAEEEEEMQEESE